MAEARNTFDASRVRITGPLTPYLPGFDDELRRLGYTATSAKIQLELVAHLSRWMAGEGLAASALTPQVVRAYLAARRAAGYRYMRSTAALEPLLGYLRRLAVTATPPSETTSSDPVELLLERYQAYLLGERGVSAKTAHDYINVVRPFLAGRLDHGQAGLSPVTAAEVSRFVVAECRRRNPRAAQGVVTAMRSVLRFLQVEGLLEHSLLGAVPAVARRQPRLPRGVDQAAVQALLDSCDHSPAGRRDFAILVVLSRLGLRCAEVAGLQLDDLDWRAGEVQIRGKGNRCDRLPLPVDVGQALVAYLRCGRPPDALDRCVFIRVKAPHQGLSPVGITQVVVSAAARAGLGWLTAHRLRHTAATAMLAAGAPLAEIGQVLRHQRPYTTSIYARVDVTALRALAMAWPGVAA
jgi:site-specific recombinase XerD